MSEGMEFYLFITGETLDWRMAAQRSWRGGGGIDTSVLRGVLRDGVKEVLHMSPYNYCALLARILRSTSVHLCGLTLAGPYRSSRFFRYGLIV